MMGGRGGVISINNSVRPIAAAGNTGPNQPVGDFGGVLGVGHWVGAGVRRGKALDCVGVSMCSADAGDGGLPAISASTIVGVVSGCDDRSGMVCVEYKTTVEPTMLAVTLGRTRS